MPSVPSSNCEQLVGHRARAGPRPARCRHRSRRRRRPLRASPRARTTRRSSRSHCGPRRPRSSTLACPVPCPHCVRVRRSRVDQPASAVRHGREPSGDAAVDDLVADADDQAAAHAGVDRGQHRDRAAVELGQRGREPLLLGRRSTRSPTAPGPPSGRAGPRPCRAGRARTCRRCACSGSRPRDRAVLGSAGAPCRRAPRRAGRCAAARRAFGSSSSVASWPSESRMRSNRNSSSSTSSRTPCFSATAKIMSSPTVSMLSTRSQGSDQRAAAAALTSSSGAGLILLPKIASTRVGARRLGRG